IKAAIKAREPEPHRDVIFISIVVSLYSFFWCRSTSPPSLLTSKRVELPSVGQDQTCQGTRTLWKVILLAFSRNSRLLGLFYRRCSENWIEAMGKGAKDKRVPRSFPPNVSSSLPTILSCVSVSLF